MRNYQPKKNNQYQLAPFLFRRMIYLVKDYTRMKELASDAAEKECRAVEEALLQLPEEYRTIIFNKVCHDKAYPIYTDPSTYSRWKCRFLYFIAEKLNYI